MQRAKIWLRLHRLRPLRTGVAVDAVLIFSVVRIFAAGHVVTWSSWEGYTAPPVPTAATNVTAIAVGFGHAVALKSDGTVLAWGYSQYGETNVPEGLSNIIAVAAPPLHSIALKSDGTVVCWGMNSCGATNVPFRIGNVVAVAAAMESDLALTTDGRVLNWDSCSLPPPSDLRDVVEISASYYNNYAARADGSVTAWGGIYLGIRPSLTNVIEMAGDFALRDDGSVIDMLANSADSVVTNAVAVSATGLSLRADGVVLDWSGAVTGPAGLSNVTTIASDGSLNLAIVGDGAPSLRPLVAHQAVLTGSNRTFRALATGLGTLAFQWTFNGIAIPGATKTSLVLTNLLPSHAGVYAVTARNARGSDAAATILEVLPHTPVVAWGYNAFGQASVPPELTAVQAIAAGDSFSAALLSDGTVVSWGEADGRSAVPAGLSNVVQIAAGGAHTLALLGNRTVVGWGDETAGQSTPPAGLTNVVAVAAGANHSLALLGNGTVRAWGYNGSGQATVPPGLDDIVAIAGGYDQSLALRADGIVFGWGDNAFLQSTPPAGLSNVVAITAGNGFSLALRDNGTVTAWGSDFGGVVSAAANFTNLIAISAGFYHALGIRADGTPVAWGNDYYDQTNVFAPLAAPLHKVIAVAAGDEHSLALLGTAPPPFFASHLNPAWKFNQFSVSVPTRYGKTYQLQYRDSVVLGDWTKFPLRAGDGTAQLLRDNTALGPYRFYRVRQW